MGEIGFNASEMPALVKFLSEHDNMKVNLAVAQGNVLAFTNSKDPHPYFYYFDTTHIIAPSIDNFIRDQAESLQITAIDISPCGSYVVTGHVNGQVILWNTKLRIMVAFLVVSTQYSVTGVALQADSTSVFVAFDNKRIDRLSLNSVMDLVTIKPENSVSMDFLVTSLESSAACDLSQNYLAVAYNGGVRIIDTSKLLEPVADFKVDSIPVIAISSYEWIFFVSIASKNQLTVYQFLDNGEYTKISETSFENNIKSINFVSDKIMCVTENTTAHILHVNGHQLATINNVPTETITSIKGSVIFVPSKEIKLETWRERLEKLRSEGQLEKAISIATSMYLGKCDEFDEGDDISDLRMIIRDLIIEFSSQNITQQQLLLIAESAIVTDTTDDLLSKTSSANLILALLHASAGTASFASTIVRRAMELQYIDDVMLEDCLLKVTLPASFTSEAIQISEKRHFFRFLIHHFDTIYDNIFPAFSHIIDSAPDRDVALTLRYVFLSGEFSEEKTNLCAVWLFSPPYNRIKHCLSVDWDSSALLLAELLKRAPITFSSSESLKESDILTVVSICFKGAPLGEADKLFGALAAGLMRTGISVPPESIESFIEFIFGASSPRADREALFLRLIERDFTGEVRLEDFSGKCVAAGFAGAVRRLYDANHDAVPMVTALLLSDSPAEALNFAEAECPAVVGSSAAIFKALLFLDSRRFVTMVIEKTDLHPSFVKQINDPTTTLMYYDALFEAGLGSEDDERYFLEYLSTRSIDRLLSFLTFLSKSGRRLQDDYLEDCKKLNLPIGCALLKTIGDCPSDAFNYYIAHIEKGGPPVAIVSEYLASHIDSVGQPPVLALRYLLRPLVNGGDRCELASRLLTAASAVIGDTVVLAALPLVRQLPPDAAALVLRSISCFHSIGGTKDAKLVEAIDRIANACRGAALSDGALTAHDQGGGVLVLETSPADAPRMGADLSASAREVFQKAESIFVEAGTRVPQDEPATIVLLIE